MAEAVQSGADGEWLAERQGHAGVITLNRPQALNALSYGMVEGIAGLLDAWEHDPAVAHVVVRAAGERAFCAGGDIRQLYEQSRSGRQAEMLRFWGDEYRLNLRIKTYPKPYVALVDGIVMGGGVGVSLHGSHRVAGGRYVFAMPEVGIGFFPDVGATYALPRLPERVGVWLALTGSRVGQADAVELGLATHAVETAEMAALVEALAASPETDAVLARFARPAAGAVLTPLRGLIARCFSGGSVEEILRRLEAEAAGEGDEAAFARKTADQIAQKSPTSLKISLRQMQLGAGLDFAEAIRTEYRIVSRMADSAEFREGVRAVIVDKDNAPRWNPARLEDVTDTAVDAWFAPLEAELELPGRESRS